jgi:hypothetical protein
LFTRLSAKIQRYEQVVHKLSGRFQGWIRFAASAAWYGDDHGEPPVKGLVAAVPPKR